MTLEYERTDQLLLWHKKSVWHRQYLLTKDLLLVSFFQSAPETVMGNIISNEDRQQVTAKLSSLVSQSVSCPVEELVSSFLRFLYIR
jgi:hypothetical protein